MVFIIDHIHHLINESRIVEFLLIIVTGRCNVQWAVNDVIIFFSFNFRFFLKLAKSTFSNF